MRATSFTLGVKPTMRSPSLPAVRAATRRPAPVLRHLNSGSSMARGQMIKGGPARAPLREQWCGPLRSFLKEFNHPPTLFGARATSSLAVQDPVLCDR